MSFGKPQSTKKHRWFFPQYPKSLSRQLRRRLRRISLMPSGVLTIEAAMVLPVFLMAMSAFLWLFDLMLFQLKLQEAMNEAVVRASAYTYAIERVKNGLSDEEELESSGSFEGGLLKAGITAAYLKSSVISSLGETLIRKAHIRGGGMGLTVLQSRFPDEDGAIDLVISYDAAIPFFPGRTGDIFCSQRSRCYAWSGTKRWAKEEREKAEQDEDPIVYITEHGTVYHTNIDCTYLNAVVESVLPKLVEGKRNESGGKYYPCERCGKLRHGLYIYITKYGDRYHTVLSCPSLERNIRQIHLSEAGGRPLCSKCAKEKN